MSRLGGNKALLTRSKGIGRELPKGWPRPHRAADGHRADRSVPGLRRVRLADGSDNFGLWRPALGRYSQEETSTTEIQMNTSSNASTERRKPMPKPFTTIVPPSFKTASETYQYAPAVRIGDQILISGIIGADAEGRLPPDFRGQAENVFTTLEAILKTAEATPHHLASLNSYHFVDFDGQVRALVDIKAKRIRPPHPAWTGGGVTQLG